MNKTEISTEEIQDHEKHKDEEAVGWGWKLPICATTELWEQGLLMCVLHDTAGDGVPQIELAYSGYGGRPPLIKNKNTKH